MRLLSVLIICFCFHVVKGQPGLLQEEWKRQTTLLGGTGLSITPTAYHCGNRQIGMGVSWIPPSHSFLEFSRSRMVSDRIFFVNLGYLPFLEVTMRLTQPLHKDHFGIGDRSVFVKLRLLEEQEQRPALSIGFHDPLGNGYHHALYAVASKSYSLKQHCRMLFNLGYGTRIGPIQNSYLGGIFWGTAFSWKILTSTLEWTSGDFNFALNCRPVSCFQVNISMLSMKKLAGNLQFSIKI